MNSLLVRIAPRFFKPSLAHSKRSIRQLALQRLDLDDPSQEAGLLNWLPQETDPELIREALKRFPQQAPLLELLQAQESSYSKLLRSQLITHLSEELASPDYTLDEQQKTLSLITNRELLLKLIQQAAALDVRLQALQQLDAKESDWLEIALSNSLSRVRFEAASQIESAINLEQLVREAQGDKRVQRLAREKLARLKAQEQQRLEAIEQKQQLVTQLQQLLNTKDQPLFAARLEHLERQWLQLAEFTANSATEELFQTHLTQAQQLAARLAEQEEAKRQREAERVAGQELQSQLLEQLENLVAHSSKESPDQLDRLSTQLQQLNLDWQTSQTQHTAPKEQQQQWAKQVQQLEDTFAAWQNFLSLRSDLQILLVEKDWSDQQQQAAHKLLHQLNWPSYLSLPEEAEALKERLQQQALQTESLSLQADSKFDAERCQADLQQLEALLAEGHSRPALRLLQQLQQRLEKAPEHFRQKHAPGLGKLAAQAAELQDWQGFVAAPKREALCEQMEALAQDLSMEPQAKADRIQALQQEWRELGSAAINRALWKRFKSAADQAYEPCKAWFIEQARSREYNQEQRQIICQELEDLTHQQKHTQLDESGLDQLLSQVHDEWRRFTPVSRTEGKRLAERFQQAISPIKSHLYELRQKHAEQKRELLAKAQELLTHEDLQEATTRSKELQSQWRQLGRAPGSLEHQLWKEFRTACDQLFKKRDEQKQSLNQAREEGLLNAQQTLAEAQQALQAGDLAQAKKLYLSAAALRSLPRQQVEAWQQKLKDFALQLDAAKRQSQNQQQLDKLKELWQQLSNEQPPRDEDKARYLTVSLETLAGLPVPEEDLALKMQLQVERLNAGIKGEATASDREQQVQALFSTWADQINSRQGSLAQRFFNALEACYQ